MGRLRTDFREDACRRVDKESLTSVSSSSRRVASSRSKRIRSFTMKGRGGRGRRESRREETRPHTATQRCDEQREDWRIYRRGKAVMQGVERRKTTVQKWYGDGMIFFFHHAKHTKSKMTEERKKNRGERKDRIRTH